jgi:excisionase family DNA binding protein
MAQLNLREAAEQAGTSKSSIYRAIKSGRLSAPRTDDGGFAIDPAELFRAFPPGNGPAKQTATSPKMDETALRQALAVAEANLMSLKDMLDEVKATRDELRQDRDDLRRDRDAWKEQAQRLALATPHTPEPAASPQTVIAAPGPVATPEAAPTPELPRRSWAFWRKAG